MRLALQLVHAAGAEGIVVHSPMWLRGHLSISVVRVIAVSAALFESVTFILGERMGLLPAWPPFLATKAEPAFALSCETDKVLSICVRWLVFPLVTLEKDEDCYGTRNTEQTKSNDKSKEP